MSPFFFDLLIEKPVEVFTFVDPEILEYEILLVTKGGYFPPFERQRLGKILYNIRAGNQKYDRDIVTFLDE